MNKLAVALILAAVAGIAAAWGMGEPRHAVVIALIVLLVTLWTNEGLPLGVVSLLPLILFPASGLVDLKSVAQNYANPVIFLFLGGFMLAIAVQKTRLHQYIAHAMLPVHVRTPRRILFSLGLISALLSSLLSNTTTALLLLPVALVLSDSRTLQARLVLAVAYGASIGGIITPIGTPPNLILLGFLESQGMTAIPFIKWMLMTLPLAIVMLMLLPWVLGIGLQKSINIPIQTKPLSSMSKEQRRLAFLLVCLALLLLLNSPVKPWYPGLGLDEKIIMLSFGLALFLPGLRFLDWEDTRSIPYEIIFLFGAGFSIANVVMSSGLAESVATSMQHFAQWPLLALILLVAVLITFSTEITSNTALVSLALPIIYTLGQMSGIDARLILMVAAICGSYAFMLPIATPPNAIAMSSGALKVREMMMLGLILNLLAILLTSLTASTYWRFFI